MIPCSDTANRPPDYWITGCTGRGPAGRRVGSGKGGNTRGKREGVNNGHHQGNQDPRSLDTHAFALQTVAIAIWRACTALPCTAMQRRCSSHATAESVVAGLNGQLIYVDRGSSCAMMQGPLPRLSYLLSFPGPLISRIGLCSIRRRQNPGTSTSKCSR